MYARDELPASEAGIGARRPAAAPARVALATGEWIALACGVVLLISLLVLPWFAVSASGVVAAGTEAGAFRWLDGIDVVLLAVALLAIGLPVLRLAGAVRTPAADLAVVVAAGGVAAAALIVYRIVAPPEIDRELASAASGAGVTGRWGAVVGLIAALGVAAGGLIAVRDRSPAPRGPRPGPPPPHPAPGPRTSPYDPMRVRLATATVEELRDLGLSVTQARRLIRYRDELGLVSTVAELDRVPGIPASLRAEVKVKLTR